MKLRLTQPMRRDWSLMPGAEGILLERDIGVGHGRLKAKLLVFDSTKHLRGFWKMCLSKGELGRYCRGAVNGLFSECIQVLSNGQDGHRWIEADPRYFCCIGLVKDHLSMEIITHESVHAAFNFSKRKSRTPWDVHAHDFDEEGICYPAGKIAASINRVLFRYKLYD